MCVYVCGARHSIYSIHVCGMEGAGHVGGASDTCHITTISLHNLLRSTVFITNQLLSLQPKGSSFSINLFFLLSQRVNNGNTELLNVPLGLIILSYFPQMKREKRYYFAIPL